MPPIFSRRTLLVIKSEILICFGSTAELYPLDTELTIFGIFEVNRDG